MMHKGIAMPVGMGALMGLVMLWMLHGMLTGQGHAGGALFVLAHVAVLLVLALAFVVARRGQSAWAQGMLKHRPSLRHVALMMGSALTTAGVIHLIHGGPV